MNIITQKHFELGNVAEVCEEYKKRCFILNKQITFLNSSTGFYNHFWTSPSCYKYSFSEISYKFPSIGKDYEYIEFICLTGVNEIVISTIDMMENREECIKITKDGMDVLSGNSLILELFELDLLDSLYKFSNICNRDTDIIRIDDLLDLFRFFGENRFIPKFVEPQCSDQAALIKSEKIREIVGDFLSELSGKNISLTYDSTEEAVFLMENGVKRSPHHYNSIVSRTFQYLPHILDSILQGDVVMFKEDSYRWFYVLPIPIIAKILEKILVYCTKDYPQVLFVLDKDRAIFEKQGYMDLMKDYESIMKSIPEP